MSSRMVSPAGARIESLLDPGSFVELGAAVKARNTDFNLTAKKEPSDGVITGYGLVDGRLVYVYSQDASVMKGTVGEMHAAKIVRLYEMAIRMGAPVIGLIDSAGMRLEESVDALDAFGQIYMAMSSASGVVPMLTGIFGTCGGGMALIPALSDFTFMEDSARLFVNSPNALPENYTEKCDTASAGFSSAYTGIVDGSGSEAEVLGSLRSLVSALPSNNEDDAVYADSQDDLNRLIADAAGRKDDPAMLLSAVSDGGFFIEAKPEYGKDTVAAFIRLNGTIAGAVANRAALFGEDGKKCKDFGGKISYRGLRKAAEFVQFCDAFSIPVITFTNVCGFDADKNHESLLAKAAAGLSYAFANATTPKINVITGSAYGTAGMLMNSKALGADVVYAWTSAKVGMMDGDSAARIMYDGGDAETINAEAKKYNDLQNSVDSAASRGYVDTVIAPEETRKYLIGAAEMLFTKREFRPDKKHGTV